MTEHTSDVNNATRVSQIARCAQPPPPPPGELLLEVVWNRLDAYRDLRPWSVALGCVVVDGEGMERRARSCVRFSGDQTPAAVIVGRHSECDLHVEDGSLRHAACVAWPKDLEGCLEVLDLDTGAGLRTEDGTPFRQLTSNTWLIFRVGRAWVMVTRAAAGKPFEHWDWPEEMQVGKTPAHVPHLLDNVGVGLVPETLSPVQDVKTGSQRLSHAAISTADGLQQLEVDPAMLEHGALIGRYARCAIGGGAALEANVSRVHALLVSRFGRTWLMDTASTNGTELLQRNGRTVMLEREDRMAMVQNGDAVRFGDNVMQLRVFASPPGE